MKHVDEHIIPGEFARIFELYEECGYNFTRYYIMRDNFYENNRSLLKHGRISKEDMETKFAREPKLNNEKLARYACANAQYYCRIMGLTVPEWAHRFDGGNYVPIPIQMYASSMKECYEHTPPELKALGFIDHERNYTIC